MLDEDGDPTGEVRTLPAAPGEDENPENEADRVILGDDLPFAQIKPYLRDALAKNFVLRQATRHTALALLPVARILCHARVVTPSAQEIKDSMDEMVKNYAIATDIAKDTRPKPTPRYESAAHYRYRENRRANQSKTPIQYKAATPPPGSCPLLNLPPEILTNILRAYTTIEPVPLPPNPSLAHLDQPTQERPPVFASALSDQHFARIIRLAEDRSTLRGYTQRYDSERKDSRSSGRISLHDDDAFLEYVGCMEYERRPL